ncbi:MAG TPA: tRNA uridine-5-carboxymethylaminomethyl(34) synthesis GTPase MnmE [Elusimicrobiales bacterium]|nr:tRNA uridine-5-carboxymethylaminomethyl(34) synthesis GTPase MnmE [Elusimicrobiales bacterium]HOL63311.1 tRNA uridine-5-carboxymethylaminomethyl(34) synthesis GTPase MnmE [Elusimicrobiales bacterium]HPO96004.1 tRNA uridine-5-carboxymethylaminomethyl(34) synthesis GTPase MnmE [Elusimicrobiales bacterium]
MYNPNDTIVSIATGPKGAIGIIRISGKDSFSISKKILKPEKAFLEPKPNASYLLKITDEKNNLIDRAMVITYLAPKSYTGEDMVEIFCHNSPYIIKKTVELFIKNGARQAREGEFSFRAFINGKMDLSQAEGINELLKAETEKQHKIAINQVNGNLSKKINLIKEELIETLSEVEVRIDDSYEEIGEISISDFEKRLKNLSNIIKKMTDTYSKSEFIKNGIKIALVGAPNSGKSSLLNKILGYERSITSDIPGTTRDTIEAICEIGGIKAVFTDTAGIRAETNDPIELEGIERTKNAVKNSDVIIYLKDISRNQSQDDKMALEIIENNAKDSAFILRVYSKSDLSHIKPKDNYLKVSAKTGENIDKLLSLISDKEEKVIDGFYDEIITSYRHYQCLSNALNEINSLLKIINGKNYEIISEHLRQALNALEDITGKTTPEDVLSKIFKNFCVGK